MSSMLFINTPSSSSSINCTYSPTNKGNNPSKQRKPITKNKPTRSGALFFLRSRAPSLRLGRWCRHCGCLHSRTKLVAKMGKGKSNDGGDDVRQDWKEPNETGLGIDAGTGKLDAPDEWTRKIAACPNAGTFRKKGMPNLDSMDIMYGGTVATGKNAFCTSGQMPKESSEGSEDSVESEEFVDPQCQPSMNYVAMEIEDPSLSRAGLAIDKGKGKLNGVQIVRGIYKKQKKKRSSVQELSDSLKSNSDVFVESRTVSTRPPIVSTATTEFKGILDMVLSLPGVESGDRLYMFSTLFFMEKAENRSMFAALVHDKDIQLKWLEMQFRRNPQFHFP